MPGYLAERGVTYPVYLTDEAALETLYPTGEATVPISVLLDPTGRILEIYPGWSERTETALRALAGEEVASAVDDPAVRR